LLLYLYIAASISGGSFFTISHTAILEILESY